MPPDMLRERVIRGFSFHDMVIETPRHDVSLWELDVEGVRDVQLAYAEHERQLGEHLAVKYVQVEP
jgi:UDPglucose--hexose-1-phosphate uridylyltransferase